MAKKIELVGAKPKKIAIVDQPKRRIDPTEVAGALGANQAGVECSGHLDLIGLGELGNQLLARLRSTGGRPALTDATEICRVPLSAEDVKALEGIVAQIEQSSGTRPSVGQLASVIVRTHLQALQAASKNANADNAPADSESPISMTTLQKIIDEQLTPLREKVNRLERELHAIGK